MKKSLILLNIIASILLGSDNQIRLEATVLPGAVVGFSDVSSESLAQSSPKVKDMTINFGEIKEGEVLPKVIMPIFVKTNTSNVTLSLDTSINNQNLQKAMDRYGLSLTYKVLGKRYVIGSSSAVEIAANPNYGKVEVGYLEVIPSSQKLPQGSYKTTLIASISLK